MKRIAIVLTSHAELGKTGKPTGYYLPEAAHAWRVFTDAGFDVVFVSPRGGAAPLDPGGQDRGDAANKAFLDDPVVQHGVRHTFRPDDLRGEHLSAIFFAGGHGTMWDFREDKALARLATDAARAGAVISAVCHGPAALVDLELDGKKLVADQPVTGFSNTSPAFVRTPSFRLSARFLSHAFRVPNRPHRMIAAKHNRMRAGTGEPPINNSWLRTAPTIVQTRIAAPTGARRGIRSRIADAISMAPVT